jgi:hypothetical protein
MNALMGRKRTKPTTDSNCSKPDTAESADKRVRKVFDSSQEILDALEYRASKEGVRRRRRVSDTELLNEILRSYLKEEIKELRQTPPEH